MRHMNLMTAAVVQSPTGFWHIGGHGEQLQRDIVHL
jgi:hypothetical protein